MRGHIRKRYKNSWEIIVSIGRDPVTGKYKHQSFSVRGTKNEAKKRLTEIQHQLDIGIFMQPRKTTLAEYLQCWLKDYVWPNLAPKTADGYELIIRRHVIPYLGNITLTQLKPEHLQKYYTDKLSNGRCDGDGGLSARTVRHHHTTLHTALATALKWGLIQRNPADAVTPPRFQNPEWKTLTEDDIHNVLDTARLTPYYTLFYLAIFTGLRRSELLALRWSDLDLYMCKVYVNRSLHQIRNGGIVFRSPKTGKGRRAIDLDAATAITLRKRREYVEAIRVELGVLLNDSDLVFCNEEDGSPLRPDTVTHAWIKLTKRIGLSGVRFHDIRHSHASLMLKQGVPAKVVSERLGHASIQITLDTYSHVTPGMQAAAADGFAQLVNYEREKEVV